MASLNHSSNRINRCFQMTCELSGRKPLRNFGLRAKESTTALVAIYEEIDDSFRAILPVRELRRNGGG